MVVYEGRWNSYGNTKVKGVEKRRDSLDRFTLNEYGDRILDVLQLKEKDTTCYISSVFFCGILDTILSICIHENTKRYTFVDVTTYMRLRILCKLFKHKIDISNLLLKSRNAVIDYIGTNNRVGHEIMYAPVSVIPRALRYYTSPGHDTIYSLLIHVIKCLDELRKENNLNVHYNVSRNIIYRRNTKQIFDISCLPVLNRVCVDNNGFYKLIHLKIDENHTSLVSIGQILDKELCRVVNVGEDESKIEDITNKYTFNDSIQRDKLIYRSTY